MAIKVNDLTGLETMKDRLRIVQSKMNQITEPHGYVPSNRRYEFNKYMYEAFDLHSAIETWEKVFSL